MSTGTTAAPAAAPSGTSSPRPARRGRRPSGGARSAVSNIGAVYVC